MFVSYVHCLFMFTVLVKLVIIDLCTWSNENMGQVLLNKKLTLYTQAHTWDGFADLFHLLPLANLT